MTATPDRDALAKLRDEMARAWGDDGEDGWQPPTEPTAEEPCAEFGSHPRGGHAREAAARRRETSYEDWGACTACGHVGTCSDASACCAECRITAGWTHTAAAHSEDPNT